jgi:S1-C subfamily serine protease
VRGALVQPVAPCSAASAAGLRPNDIIVAIDGSPIPAAAALTADVAGRHPAARPSDVAQLTFTVSLGGTQRPSALM